MTSARDTTISNKTILDYWKDNPNGTGTEGKGYNEPYPRDDEDSIVVNEWNAMYASVIKYGGFYVGRYETGNPGTYYPNQLTWSSSTPVIKSGVLPWHTIAAGTTYEITDESSAGIAPTVSRNMYPSSNTTYGAVSTLIYGIQWDTIMNWTGKGSAYVASKSEVGKTGSVSADCYNNIYDLSGNVSEWTMEVYATYDRVYRGGYYGNTETANLRQSTTQWNTNSSCGFRTALYVE